MHIFILRLFKMLSQISNQIHLASQLMFHLFLLTFIQFLLFLFVFLFSVQSFELLLAFFLQLLDTFVLVLQFKHFLLLLFNKSLQLQLKVINSVRILIHTFYQFNRYMLFNFFELSPTHVKDLNRIPVAHGRLNFDRSRDLFVEDFFFAEVFICVLAFCFKSFEFKDAATVKL